MKGKFNHYEIHAARFEETSAFYRDLLVGYMEWTVAGEWPGGLGLTDGGVSLWWSATEDGNRSIPFNRDASGIGHIGIQVDDRAAVETFIREFMEPRGLKAEFDTPRAREEFGPGYYQVMFLDPEGLAVEIYSS